MFALLPLFWIVRRNIAFASLAFAAAVLLAAPAFGQDLLDGDSGSDPAAEGQQPAQQQQLTAEDVQRMFTEADAALNSGEYDKALSGYDQLIRILKPQGFQAAQFLPTLYTGRGRSFLALDDPESALNDFNEALKENAQHFPALVARGTLYLGQNATDLALQDFQAAMEMDRRNPDVLFGMGKAYVLLGGMPQAIKPLSYVIAAQPENAEALRLRAQAYAGVGKYKEAQQDIESSLALDGENFETYFAQATVLLREEKYEEASKALDEAILRYKPRDETSDEPFAQGYLTKAAVLLEMGKKAEDHASRTAAYKAALVECDKLIDLIGDAPQYASVKAAAEFRRGVCLRMLGQYGDAIASFTDAINASPDLAEAYFRRGICFYHIGEENLAIKDFKHAGNIEYTDPRPRLWEGFAYAKLGNYHEAIRSYGSALVESDRYVPAYVNRGLAYMALGENEKAVADFEAAVRLEPAEWTHYFKRGVAHQRLGNHQRAADSFANAVRFNKNEDYAPAYHRAAESLSNLGRSDLANEYRSKAGEVEAKANDSK